MLTQLTTRRLDVPGEAGEWIEVRPLSGRRKREAIKARQAAALQTMTELGSDTLAAIRAGRESMADDAKDDVDPYAQYDQEHVLASSIVAWSYDVPVTPESIDDLDAPTQDYLFRELVKPLIQRSEREKLERFFDSTPA